MMHDSEFELHITSYEKFIQFINLLKGGMDIDEELDILTRKLRNARTSLQITLDKITVQKG